MKQPQKNEIKFPCRWEFRVIAIAELRGKTSSAISQIGKLHGKNFEISDGENSNGGKYAALRLACEVTSIEEARAVAADLAKAEGVRFLL